MVDQHSFSNICRLCMENAVLDIFQMDGDVGVHHKINSCLDIKVQPQDGLPSSICTDCKNKISDFYNFKIKCIKINEQLKSMNILLKVNVKTENLKLENFNDSVTDDKLLEIQKSESVETLNYFEETQKNNELDFNDSFYDHDSSDNSNNIHNKINAQNSLLNYTKKKEKKVHQCEFCGRIFKTKSVLSTHIVTHTGEKQYVCNICKKRFTRMAHKIVHMRIHTGLRPFVCDTCGKASTKRQDLIRHMRIHSDEKKYSCPRCDRKFKRSGDVHAHMRSHTGVRPYSCKHCEKTYSCHSGLAKHYKKHCEKDLEKNQIKL